jgi:hypothetical protein
MAQQAPPDLFQSTDAALASWCQGDVILHGGLFAHHIALAGAPLTDAAKQVAIELQASNPEDLLIVTTEAPGFIVLTQTCDLRRSSKDRKFVELAPLVVVSPEMHAEIARCKRPAFANIPTLADRRLVADLDRSMTVEKAVLATLTRTPGMTSDLEIADFQRALARSKGRFAFPDAFNDAMKRFQKRMVDRAGKQSPEGAHVNAVVEIRISAEPAWDAAEVGVTLWLIIKDDPAPQQWTKWINEWEGLIDQTGRFKLKGPLRLRRLEDMRASEYVGSYPLDLDHLSAS